MTITAELFVRLFAPQPWMVDAACKGMPTELFFPERGVNVGPTLEVCNTCPVKAECRQAGRDEVYGVWGGVTARNRRGERSTPSDRVLFVKQLDATCGTTVMYSRGCRCDDCRAAHNTHVQTRRGSSKDAA